MKRLFAVSLVWIGFLTSDSGMAAAGETDRLRGAIGQMVLLEFDVGAPHYVAAKGGDHRTAIADMLGLVEEFRLGGFVIEGHNDALLLDPGFAAVRLAEALDGLRPFVAANEEGGGVQIASDYWFDHQAEWVGCTSLGEIPDYQANAPEPSENWTCPDHPWSIDRQYFPFLRNAHLMGARWTPDETKTHAGDIGRALAKLNITMNLAPVLGVSDGTTKASFLGDRTFADDPAKVAQWARAFSQGIRAGSGGQVVTVIKHFPGLGSVTDDTDNGRAVAPPLTALTGRDLVPFERPVTEYYGASAVMMSNAVVPGLTCASAEPDCSIPATLSTDAYALLRGLGWNGLVMTDSMQTPAVLINGMSMGQAVVSAIDAGADMVMVKPDKADKQNFGAYLALLRSIRAAVADWVAADPIPRQAQLEQSVEKIKAAKAEMRR